MPTVVLNTQNDISSSPETASWHFNARAFRAVIPKRTGTFLGIRPSVGVGRDGLVPN
jgi:hypothetical protein